MTDPDDWWRTFFTGAAAACWLAVPTEEHTRQEADFVERALNVAPRSRLLDVPCGGGRHSAELARRGHLMTGLDISSEFIQTARARGVDVTWEEREMRDLPWRAHFDGAYCLGNSFGYLDDKGNADFLKAVARVLRPGARFVFETGYVVESLIPSFQERAWYPVDDQFLLAHRRFEPAEGRIHVEYTFVRDGAIERRSMSARVYMYREIMELMKGAGFTNVVGLGSRDGAPYRLGSPQLIVVGEATAGA